MAVKHQATHDAQFVRVKKLTGKDILRLAGKHNLREIQAEIGADSHIDAERIRLNRVLEGPGNAAEIAALADRLMEEAGIGALRKNAVRGVEVVISLPSVSSANQPAFFVDALALVKAFYGVPVLSAVIHNDEAAPHAHFLLLPLVDGKMNGSDLVGNRTRLRAMQTGFYEQVAQPHGLRRPKAAQRLSAATRAKSASMILSALQSAASLLDRPDIEAGLLAAIGRDPVALLAALSLAVPHPPKSTKSFVEIMTKPCGLEKPIGFAGRSKPIGFDAQDGKKEQTLSCVGFAPESPPISTHSLSPEPPESPPLEFEEWMRREKEKEKEKEKESTLPSFPSTTLHPGAHSARQKVTDDVADTRATDSSDESPEGYTRTHDGDESTQAWDYATGEFAKPPVRKASVRQVAQAEINRALRQRFH